MESLPKTLDETYEKILCAIDDEHSEKVVKLLHWLAYSPRPLHIEELAEVVAVNVGSKPRIDSEARFLEPRDILTICSSLVTTETDITGIPYGQKVGGQIRLAHLSVRDYLTSERIRAREGAQYCVQEVHAHELIGQTCLAYLLHFDEPDSLQGEWERKFPLARYAAEYWAQHIRASGKETEQTIKLAKEMLSNPYTFMSI